MKIQDVFTMFPKATPRPQQLRYVKCATCQGEIHDTAVKQDGVLVHLRCRRKD